MMSADAGRDAGLGRAVEACGSLRALARQLGRHHSAVQKWQRVPKGHVFDVERVSGVAAEELRPDLASMIRLARQRQALARARERFGFTGATTTARGPALKASGQVRGVQAAGHRVAVDLFELGLVVAAMQWVAARRGLRPAQVYRGVERHEASARAYALALAFVAGRVSSTVVAGVVGTTRQNVENCAERYLRARDGDDGDDWDDPDFDPKRAGYVIERGRKRRQKTGNDDLWAAEAAFLNWLEGRE